MAWRNCDNTRRRVKRKGPKAKRSVSPPRSRARQFRVPARSRLFGQGENDVRSTLRLWRRENFARARTRDDFAAAIIARGSAWHRAAHVCGLCSGVVPSRVRRGARTMSIADLADALRAPEAKPSRPRSREPDMRASQRTRGACLRRKSRAPPEVIDTRARIDPAAYRIGAERVWLARPGERAAAIQVPIW